LKSKQFFLQGNKPEIANITGGKHILTHNNSNLFLQNPFVI